ncbi:uncharacterized protein [Narcine bancroftii]|uniref:uncharacterized protein n=1 Tax=Narcine bancroftii TaxID=1343680 RepID=UPI0038320E17
MNWSDGGLFNLRRLQAHTKTQEQLVRELIFADEAALVAHSEPALQRLTSSKGPTFSINHINHQSFKSIELKVFNNALLMSNSRNGIKLLSACVVLTLFWSGLQMCGGKCADRLHHSLSGDTNTPEQKVLQKVVDTAQNITSGTLPTIENIYRDRCSRRAEAIIKDPTAKHTHCSCCYHQENRKKNANFTQTALGIKIEAASMA